VWGGISSNCFIANLLAVTKEDSSPDPIFFSLALEIQAILGYI
jgi:hypothetical protein